MAITDFIDELLNRKRYMAYRMLFDGVGNKTHADEVLKDLCAAHSVFDSGFDSDPLELSRMAGERNVVLRILTMLKLNPSQIAELAPEDEEVM